MTREADVAVVGAGAAGLMAAIFAARTARARGLERSVVLLEGAKRPGAKILVSGGGRCNVTHHVVDERAFSGSTPHAIRKVLRRFDVPLVIDFFREQGVELKREETGKLFPTTDDAHTVLSALLVAASSAGADLLAPWRVEAVEHDPSSSSFRLRGAAGEIRARRLVLATGGKSLPKSGSDGAGYELARGLGHTLTPRVFPALVPLLLAPEHWITRLSGLSARATLEVRSSAGKRRAAFTDALLCTHFGISGPVVLDVSRHYVDAALDEPGARLVASWLPGETFERVDAALLALGKRSPGRWLRERGLPERLADALCAAAGVDGSRAAHSLTRETRRALALALVETVLPVRGDRGFTYAEVTAGGVPLSELDLDTMESRILPGLHLVGEICDVDGRIGGFNFQWAWASGYVAGCAAGRADEMRS
jgi:predicted Rossmann fold flavoprotein